MGKYAIGVTAFTTPTGTADTAASIEAAAGEAAEVVELIMTGSGTTTAADTMHRAVAALCDFTTQGTAGASPTPEKFNQAANASLMSADIEYTAEPTNINTVELLTFGFNQRGGMRWAVPQGEGIAIRGNDTEKGVVWTVISAAAGAVDGAMHWWEP